jgi:hypothetical protein
MVTFQGQQLPYVLTIFMVEGCNLNFVKFRQQLHVLLAEFNQKLG